MIVEKYNYAALKREQTEKGRLYVTAGGKLPSVTTILDATKSAEKKQALQNWRNRIGHANAQQITTEAANVGTVMHKKLEEYCLGKRKPPGSNIIQQQADKMALEVINNGLVHMDECWGVEVGLYYDGLYAGTTDCVGQFGGEPAIMDFKQTNKPKKTEYIEDYFVQLAAYAAAHNKMFGTDIKKGVILMCSRAFEYQQWIIEGDEFAKYTDMWFDKVKEYYLANA